MYQWDNRNLKEFQLPDIWYFRWQKELLGFFGSRTDFDFIWKAFPTNETYDPIPEIINDERYDNIRYVATVPYLKIIQETDMTLLDVPSTALYEASAAGVPVLSLYFAPFTIIRKSARIVFGRSLQPFFSYMDGVAKVEIFLNSNPAEYTVALPLPESSVVEILTKL